MKRPSGSYKVKRPTIGRPAQGEWFAEFKAKFDQEDQSSEFELRLREVPSISYISSPHLARRLALGKQKRAEIPRLDYHLVERIAGLLAAKDVLGENAERSMDVPVTSSGLTVIQQKELAGGHRQQTILGVSVAPSSELDLLVAEVNATRKRFFPESHQQQSAEELGIAVVFATVTSEANYSERVPEGFQIESIASLNDVLPATISLGGVGVVSPKMIQT